jgi:hypothetical protein
MPLDQVQKFLGHEMLETPRRASYLLMTQSVGVGHASHKSRLRSGQAPVHCYHPGEGRDSPPFEARSFSRTNTESGKRASPQARSERP